jgi:hypothetical protein
MVLSSPALAGARPSYSSDESVLVTVRSVSTEMVWASAGDAAIIGSRATANAAFRTGRMGYS